jgi:hypothetical protein
LRAYRDATRNEALIKLEVGAIVTGRSENEIALFTAKSSPLLSNRANRAHHAQRAFNGTQSHPEQWAP